MIALVAALLLAQAPAPAGAAAPDARSPEDPGRAAEVRGARSDEPPDPPRRGDRRADDRARDRARDPAPSPDPRDEAVIRDLELLENLGLLQELELFDAAGDPPPKARPPAPPPRAPEDPARGRPGDAPRR